MARWDATVPRVTVKMGAPKSVTFVYPYYESPEFLRIQAAGWKAYPADVRDYLSFIVVDDGSPEPATVPDVAALRLFRIGVDIRWNWLAARNIGAHHASDGWLLLTDMDHVVPAGTARAVVYGQHDPSVIYLFSRREHTGAAAPPHSASYLMTREMFWRVGGYDERLSGFYGTDGMFRRRCADVAPLRILTDVLVRHEFQRDASTRRYARKQAEDTKLPALVASFPKGSKPLTLSFPYEEVTSC